MDNYEQLITRISESANVGKEEIERKVEAKRAKLSHLVSKEGAAQIVAAELGLNLDQQKLKISELVDGMRRANVVGKVLKIFPVREFEKNGRAGKVCNILLADESSNVKVVLWDTNHIALIENKTIGEGDAVEISNGGIRNGELHLSSFADIKKSKEKMGEVVEKQAYKDMKLIDAKPGQSVNVRAFVVQSFEPRYFEVNAKTGRKMTEEEKAKGEKAEKRALLNVVLDDGSETLRAVIFGEEIKKLGLTDEEIFSLEKFEKAKLGMLGAERIFSGNVRQNQLYNTTEMSIERIEEVNPDELIKELEAKQ